MPPPAAANRTIHRAAQNGKLVSTSAAPVIEQILDLARWAPSGDNTQPWRFEITGELSAVIHGFDTRDHCVYDIDGHSSQMAIGGLLETICIAATGHSLGTKFKRRTDFPDETPTFDLTFTPD